MAPVTPVDAGDAGGTTTFNGTGRRKYGPYGSSVIDVIMNAYSSATS